MRKQRKTFHCEIFGGHDVLTYRQIVAKAALRRKKAFEHQLEQTSAQMMTVEREISSIEAANINKETLDAMKGAQQAMKTIHAGLTIANVDQTMEDLRDSHAVGEEIAEALTQGNMMQGLDEDELEQELADMQQEDLDNKMLKTGSVPVSDQVHRLPNAAVGEREFTCFDLNVKPSHGMLIISQSKAKNKPKTGRKRNFDDYRRKWPCDLPSVVLNFGMFLGRRVRHHVAKFYTRPCLCLVFLDRFYLTYRMIEVTKQTTSRSRYRVDQRDSLAAKSKSDVSFSCWQYMMNFYFY